MRGPLRRLTAKQPLWVLVTFLALSAVGTALFLGRRASGAPSVRIGADGRYYWAFLTSLLLDGDLDFENQYANPRSGNYYQYLRTETGHHANVATIGPALLWIPTFLVARGVSRLVESPAEYADGTSDLTQVITLYGSFLMGVVAAVLAYVGARERYGPGPACAGAVVAIAAGPVLHYLISQPHYAHAPSALAVTALLYAWDRGRGGRRVRGWAVLGALVGVAMLVRTQNLAFALPACVEGAVALVAAARRGGPSAAARALLGPLAALAVALVVFFPQLLAWKIIYGSWVGVPQGAGYIRWDASAWSECLFSSRNGLFPYAPLWLLGLLGLALVARRDRWLAAGLFGSFVLTTYVNGAFWHWWGMGSFGGRRFDGLVYPVALGCAALVGALLAAFERRPRLVGGLFAGASCAGFVVLNTVASLDYGRHLGNQPDSVRSLDVYDRTGRLLAEDLFRWGNPIEWPAALAFALRTGAPMASYEDVVGPQLLDGYQVAYQPPPAPPRGELSFARDARYLVSGFGPPRGNGKDQVRPVGGRARFLVPLNLATGASLRLQGRALAAGTLRIRWNGDELAAVALTPGAPLDEPLALAADRIERGVNLVDLAVTPPPGEPSVPEPLELGRLLLAVP